MTVENPEPGGVNSGSSPDALPHRPPFSPQRSCVRSSILLVLVPLALVAVVISAFAAGPWKASHAPQRPAPQSLASFHLQVAEVFTGPQAVAQISRLPGAGAAIVDGYVAYYQGSSNGANLYVGETTSEDAAALLLKQVEEDRKLSSVGLESIRIEGIKLFSLPKREGMLYFWQSGAKVIWIAFDRDDRAELAAAVKQLSR